MIGVQLHISLSQALVDLIAPVENDEMPFRKKPKYGFWTSSWREETQDSDWVEWCRGEDFDSPEERQWFLLTPKADARLYVIDCYTDLERLLNAYTWESPMAKRLRQTVGENSHLLHYYQGIDFERLALDYDGLHLTERGNAKLHLSYPHDMNAWDSESTVWFRWCFSEVRRIETPKPTQEEATA